MHCGDDCGRAASAERLFGAEGGEEGGATAPPHVREHHGEGSTTSGQEQHHEAGGSAKAHAEHGSVEIAQRLCPVMAKAISRKVFVDYEGRRVYFCCGMCTAQFEQDPAKYLAEMDAGPTEPQTN